MKESGLKEDQAMVANPVKCWSTEEWEGKEEWRKYEVTEEMVQWRSFSQKELDKFWKEMCQVMAEEVLEKYQMAEVKKVAYKRNKVQQQRTQIIGRMSRRVKAKGRMNANNSWWVSDLVAATCECAGLNRDWDGTAQSLQEWLYEMKKNDEGQKEEEHQKLVRRMIASAEGGAGWLHRISKPTVWREGIQILREEEDNNRPMERSEEKKKELDKAPAVQCRRAQPSRQAMGK